MRIVITFMINSVTCSNACRRDGLNNYECHTLITNTHNRFAREYYSLCGGRELLDLCTLGTVSKNGDAEMRAGKIIFSVLDA